MINNAIYINKENVLIPCKHCFQSHEYVLYTNKEYDCVEFFTAYDMVFRPMSPLIPNARYDEKSSDNTSINYYKYIALLRRETGI